MTRADDRLGVLEGSDAEGWRIRFERRLAHPVEVVWAAVSEREQLRAWFPQDVVGERRAGAPLRFLFEPDGADGFDGELVAFDPPHLLEMRWGTDLLRIELASDGDGGTVLTLTDRFDELGKASRDAAGWHECLARLVSALDGSPPPPLGSLWKQALERYRDAFGPEGSSIGPPPGFDPA